MLDFLIVDDNKIKTVYNNLNSDSFFLKARMLSDPTTGSPIRSASFRAVLTSVDD